MCLFWHPTKSVSLTEKNKNKGRFMGDDEVSGTEDVDPSLPASFREGIYLKGTMLLARAHSLSLSLP